MLNIDLMRLGTKIREARKECGLTQSELAEQIGISLKTIQNIEKGLANPYFDTLYRLIHRLGIPSDILFDQELSEQDEVHQRLIIAFDSFTPMQQEALMDFMIYLGEKNKSSKGQTIE